MDSSSQSSASDATAADRTIASLSRNKPPSTVCAASELQIANGRNRAAAARTDDAGSLLGANTRRSLPASSAFTAVTISMAARRTAASLSSSNGATAGTISRPIVFKACAAASLAGGGSDLTTATSSTAATVPVLPSTRAAVDRTGSESSASMRTSKAIARSPLAIASGLGRSKKSPDPLQPGGMSRFGSSKLSSAAWRTCGSGSFSEFAARRESPARLNGGVF